MKLHYFFLSCLCFGKTITLEAQQQQSQYTQYMYNQMGFNPAYTGSQDKTIIYGQYRTQWVGLEGAPKTSNVSINSPISERGNGLGFSIENDEIGPTSTNTFDINYSYAIPFENYTTLFFGVKAAINNFEVDYTKLQIKNDENTLSGKTSRFSPNIGIGLYIQNDTWFAGVSIPRMLKTNFYNDVSSTIASEKMHFYFNGGFLFDLNPDLIFKPSILVRYAKENRTAIDISTNFLLNQKFTLGMAYRVNAALSGLLAFQISKETIIGYAYDHDTTPIGNYARGSHEFIVKFNLEPLAKTTTSRQCWCN